MIIRDDSVINIYIYCLIKFHFILLLFDLTIELRIIQKTPINLQEEIILDGAFFSSALPCPLPLYLRPVNASEKGALPATRRQPRFQAPYDNGTEKSTQYTAAGKDQIQIHTMIILYPYDPASAFHQDHISPRSSQFPIGHFTDLFPSPDLSKTVFLDEAEACEVLGEDTTL